MRISSTPNIYFVSFKSTRHLSPCAKGAWESYVRRIFRIGLSASRHDTLELQTRLVAASTLSPTGRALNSAVASGRAIVCTSYA